MMISNEVYGIHEIAILGENAGSLTSEINTIYIPNRVLMSSTQALEEYPLTAGKGLDGDTNIYVCKNYSCQLPVKNIDGVKQILNID